MEISFNTKLEVAIEILAVKIAETAKKKQEIKRLLKEREEMYKGNIEVIEKVINEYGPEIKI